LLHNFTVPYPSCHLASLYTSLLSSSETLLNQSSIAFSSRQKLYKSEYSLFSLCIGNTAFIEHARYVPVVLDFSGLSVLKSTKKLSASYSQISNTNSMFSINPCFPENEIVFLQQHLHCYSAFGSFV
jgi:hypothetical protein